MIDRERNAGKMSKTRSDKYRELRDTISFDSQVEMNKKALKDFEERLNNIDPHLMDTVGTDFTAEPDLLEDTSHRLRPFGSVSAKAKPKEDIDVGGLTSSVKKRDTAKDVMVPGGNSDRKPQTKEELQNEIRNLFRETTVQPAPVYVPTDTQENDSVDESTAEIPKRKKALKAKSTENEEPADQTKRLINIILWMIIAILSVILLVIVYMIFTRRG